MKFPFSRNSTLKHDGQINNRASLRIDFRKQRFIIENNKYHRDRKTGEIHVETIEVVYT